MRHILWPLVQKAQLMYSSRKHAVELVDLNSMEIVFEHQACFNKLKFQTGSFDFHDPQVRFNSHVSKSSLTLQFFQKLPNGTLLQLSREHSKETGWRWETIGELVDEPDKRVINYEFGTPEMAKNCISGTISSTSVDIRLIKCEP